MGKIAKHRPRKGSKYASLPYYITDFGSQQQWDQIINNFKTKFKPQDFLTNSDFHDGTKLQNKTPQKYEFHLERKTSKHVKFQSTGIFDEYYSHSTRYIYPEEKTDNKNMCYLEKQMKKIENEDENSILEFYHKAKNNIGVQCENCLNPKQEQITKNEVSPNIETSLQTSTEYIHPYSVSSLPPEDNIEDRNEIYFECISQQNKNNENEIDPNLQPDKNEWIQPVYLDTNYPLTEHYVSFLKPKDNVKEIHETYYECNSQPNNNNPDEIYKNVDFHLQPDKNEWIRSVYLDTNYPLSEHYVTFLEPKNNKINETYYECNSQPNKNNQDVIHTNVDCHLQLDKNKNIQKWIRKVYIESKSSLSESSIKTPTEKNFLFDPCLKKYNGNKNSLNSECSSPSTCDLVVQQENGRPYSYPGYRQKKNKYMPRFILRDYTEKSENNTTDNEERYKAGTYIILFLQKFHPHIARVV